jgi:hypothetical protein
VLSKLQTVDGSGSGLDADTVDGVSSTAFVQGTQTIKLATTWFKTGESVDSITFGETPFFVAPANSTVTGVTIAPAHSLTANDTNFATITVRKRDAGGTGPTTVATAQTTTSGAGGTGNWSPFAEVPVPLSGTPADLQLTAGQELTVQITKSGSGVAVPECVLVVQYTQTLG